MIEDAQRVGKNGNSSPAIADSACEGVSVVICCYNSANLLPPVLEHLKAQQQVPPDLLWEVVVVDNASTDDTAAVARRCWQGFEKVPLRVVSEPRLGLSNARERAFKEASYELVTFVDDDNWVDEHWIKVVSEVMSEPRLGAVGSYNEPVADVPLPMWFDRYAGMYAASAERDVLQQSESIHRLCGAGMTVRKSAWRSLKENGFRQWLGGRNGRLLSCGEDTELSYALYLSGWVLLLEPRLRLRHFMPQPRLEWRYFRRMVRSYAASHVSLDPYHLLGQAGRNSVVELLRHQWWWHLRAPLVALARRPVKAAKAVFRPLEADPEVVELEAAFGRLLGLLKLRGRYGIARREIQRARWRKLESLL